MRRSFRLGLSAGASFYFRRARLVNEDLNKMNRACKWVNLAGYRVIGSWQRISSSLVSLLLGCPACLPAENRVLREN
jgi:hypothetical protein